jgi:hypothetical protein
LIREIARRLRQIPHFPVQELAPLEHAPLPVKGPSPQEVAEQLLDDLRLIHWDEMVGVID